MARNEIVIFFIFFGNYYTCTTILVSGSNNIISFENKTNIQSINNMRLETNIYAVEIKIIYNIIIH